MLARHVIIQVLLVVNGSDCFAQASRLLGTISIQALEGADNEAVSKQEFLVERCCKRLTVSIAASRGEVDCPGS